MSRKRRRSLILTLHKSIRFFIVTFQSLLKNSIWADLLQAMIPRRCGRCVSVRKHSRAWSCSTPTATWCARALSPKWGADFATFMAQPRHLGARAVEPRLESLSFDLLLQYSLHQARNKHPSSMVFPISHSRSYTENHSQQIQISNQVHVAQSKST